MMKVKATVRRFVRRWTLFLALVPILALPPFWRVNAQAAEPIITNPAPQGEKASTDYQVDVAGKPIFVYTAPVLHGGPVSFAYFDISSPVTVTVTSAQKLARSRFCLRRMASNQMLWTTKSPSRSPNPRT